MKEKVAAHVVTSGIEGVIKSPNLWGGFAFGNHHSQLYIFNVFSF